MWAHVFLISEIVSEANSSPGVCFLSSDDLPDLQEVREEAEPTAPPVYQVEVGVSHQCVPPGGAYTLAHSPQPPDTRWLTQLAHIATGPQSPLLQGTPHSRCVHFELKFEFYGEKVLKVTSYLQNYFYLKKYFCFLNMSFSKYSW